MLIIGTIDFSHLLKENGLEVTRNDLDGANAGRTIGSGFMIRDRIAQKKTVKASFRDMPFSDVHQLAVSTKGEWLTVTYRDPEPAGGLTTSTMYCSSFPATLAYNYNGTELWIGPELTFVER